MINSMTPPGANSPDSVLIRLVDRRGTLAMIRAPAGVLVRHRLRRPAVGAMPDYLRRDIGLPERGDRPPPVPPMIWR